MGKKFTVSRVDLFLAEGYIYFSRGCDGNVKIRITRGDSVIAPASGYVTVDTETKAQDGDVFVGDDCLLPIDFENTQMYKGVDYTIEYVNLDTTGAHDVSIGLEIRMAGKKPADEVMSDGSHIPVHHDRYANLHAERVNVHMDGAIENSIGTTQRHPRPKVRKHPKRVNIR